MFAWGWCRVRMAKEMSGLVALPVGACCGDDIEGGGVRGGAQVGEVGLRSVLDRGQGLAGPLAKTVRPFTLFRALGTLTRRRAWIFPRPFKFSPRTMRSRTDDVGSLGQNRSAAVKASVGERKIFNGPGARPGQTGAPTLKDTHHWRPGQT
ncbi:hypothetical protein THAOC_22258, partial [Thalassiosira oceanica]